VFATLRKPDFALLWLAGLISVAGDYALIAALPVHAFMLTGSAAAGGVFAATLVPRVLLGSIAGVYVDRWDRKRTMVLADILRAACILPLFAVSSADLLWLLYLVRLVTGIVGLVFDPAENALLPKLVGEEHLISANALNALNDNLGRLVGPAVGGVLYASGGIGAVVLVDAVSFLGSAALIAAIRTNARVEQATGDSPHSPLTRLTQELRDGLSLVGRNPVISAILVSIGIGMLAEGTFQVGFAPLVLEVFDGGAQGAGIVLSAQAIGGLIAGALVARAASKVAPKWLFASGLLGLGIADLGMVNAATIAGAGPSAVAVAAAFMVIAGFPAVALNASAMGIVQMETVDAFRGRVFGAFTTIQGLSTLAGLVIGTLAIDRFGIVPVLSAGAGMWIVGGLIALTRLPGDAGRNAPDNSAISM